MVQKISHPIALAVEAAAERLRGGEGRLVYAGQAVPFVSGCKTALN